MISISIYETFKSVNLPVTISDCWQILEITTALKLSAENWISDSFDE